MGASITLAGESLIAQKLGTKQRLDVVRFIFANVPSLDPNAPVDRAAAKPPAAQIVYSYTIPEDNIGFVNPNQVVYSSMLGSDIGDFDWNWLGLETAENVLLAVAYMPLQQKRKNIPPLQLGNNVTRNILVAFDGAHALTGITVDASTWQHDFTVRLKGIDERERLSNRDIFGRACFFDSALQVEKVGQTYRLKAGQAYVEGVRVMVAQAIDIAPQNLPTTAWLDVALQRQLNDAVASWQVVFAADKADYVDSVGTQHYCIALADLTASTITDRRAVEPIKGPLLQHLAARVGDYPGLRARATTKDDVELGNLPNAISDDDATDSSEVLASTKAVHTVRQEHQRAINGLIEGTTPAGKAKQLETARNVSISGAGTGSVSFDGSKDVDLALTLADSGIKAGTYAKVTINVKGLVTDGGALKAADIPDLDWSKIKTGKPTTLEDYGITNAIPTGHTDKRPIFFAPVPGSGYSLGALEIREAQLAMASKTTFDYAPRITLHWGGIVTGDIAMTSDGDLCWMGQKLWTAGNFDPNTAVHAGAIVAFPFTATPAGYLKANGAAVSRTVYHHIFALLGTYYGAGDGSTTFNLPDLRGRFIRALDEGAGWDPGRALGSLQDSQNAWHAHTASSGVAGLHNHPGSGTFSAGAHAHTGSTTSNGSHQHGLTMGFTNLDSGNFGGGHTVYGTQYTNPAGDHIHGLNIDGVADHSHAVAVAYDGGHAHTVTVDPSGGNESRPVNIALIYCIKY